MPTTRVASLLTVFLALFSVTHIANADALYTFETNSQNAATPFTNTVNGLSATFGGSASVCDSTGLFVSLSGNVLIQSFCANGQSGPLTISFSSNLTGIRFNFATAGGVGTLALTAFENATSAGAASFVSTLPSGYFNGEGIASFSGTFNRVTLTGSTFLALDNINAATTAVPEPASLGVVAASFGLLALWTRKRLRMN